MQKKILIFILIISNYSTSLYADELIPGQYVEQDQSIMGVGKTMMEMGGKGESYLDKLNKEREERHLKVMSLNATKRSPIVLSKEKDIVLIKKDKTKGVFESLSVPAYITAEYKFHPMVLHVKGLPGARWKKDPLCTFERSLIGDLDIDCPEEIPIEQYGKPAKIKPAHRGDQIGDISGETRLKKSRSIYNWEDIEIPKVNITENITISFNDLEKRLTDYLKRKLEKTSLEALNENLARILNLPTNAEFRITNITLSRGTLFSLNKMAIYRIDPDIRVEVNFKIPEITFPCPVKGDKWYEIVPWWSTCTIGGGVQTRKGGITLGIFQIKFKPEVKKGDDEYAQPLLEIKQTSEFINLKPELNISEIFNEKWLEVLPSEQLRKLSRSDFLKNSGKFKPYLKDAKFIGENNTLRLEIYGGKNTKFETALKIKSELRKAGN